MKNINTLGQERSKFALEKVLEIKKKNAASEFRTFSAGAPTMILQNGFGQALAFWCAKNKEHFDSMFDIVREWLNQRGFITSSDKESFFKNISSISQSEYISAQKEAMNLLEWVKRYSHSFISDK
ncbi:MAG: type III-B CRISPR module-associated protein Cmr5 [Candidatus Muiribacteriota bacterium]